MSIFWNCIAAAAHWLSCRCERRMVRRTKAATRARWWSEFFADAQLSADGLGSFRDLRAARERRLRPKPEQPAMVPQIMIAFGIVAAIIFFIFTVPIGHAKANEPSPPVCEHPFNSDVSAAKLIIGSHPGQPGIVAESSAPEIVAAFLTETAKVLGPPTRFKSADVTRVLFMMSSRGAYLFLYDRSDCRIGNTAIPPGVIVKALKSTTGEGI